MQQNAEKNLILAMSRGLDWNALRPFFASLRMTGYDGDIRVWVSETTAQTEAELRTAGVDVVRFRELQIPVGRRMTTLSNRRFRVLHRAYPYLFATTAALSARATMSLAAAITSPFVARFILYYRFLASASTRYRYVMLTDLRDVLFQRDPFAFEIGDVVNCFLEDASQTLGSNGVNARWIESAYGPAVLRELSDLPVSCAGVTIAPHDRMVDYLATMASALSRTPSQIAGIDQGVHNYVIRKCLTPQVRLVGNDQGPVFTMAYAADLRFDDAGLLVRSDALPYNVLHQYDRHRDLALVLQKRLTGTVAPV